MRHNTFFRQALQASLVALLTCSILSISFATPNQKLDTVKGTAGVKINNFGQINDHIYRGAQPKGDNYRQLAAIGVKTIVDLRGDAERGARTAAEGAGLRYINLPLADKQYPQADAAQQFLDIVNNQENWPVYVHCAGGRHRTGSMIATYRMSVDHWTIDQAYDEMKQYDFYTSGGHGCYKDYVYDYYRDLQRQQQAQPTKSEQPVVKSEKHF